MNKKIKIAVFEPNFFIPKANAGSALVLLQNQVKALAESGNEVIVFAEEREDTENLQRQYNCSFYNLHGSFSSAGSLFSPTNTVISYFSGFFSPDLIIRAIKSIKKINPDVIFTSGTSFASVFSAILGRYTEIPTVHYIFEYTGKWRWWRGDVDTMKGYKVPFLYLMKQIMNTIPRELLRRDFLQRWGLRNTTRIIASSELVRNKLAEYSISRTVPVIYPLVKQPVLTGERKESLCPLIAYFGHLWQGRGVLDLVVAFSKIAGDYPDARLVIAASNIQRLTEYYFSALIKKYNLSEKLIFKNVVEDIYMDVIAPATVICLPYRDTPSMKLLESMAAEKTVITTTVGWTNEVITDGVNGFLVNAGDVQELARRIRMCLENDDLRISIARKARETIREKFSSEAHTRHLISELRAAADWRR